MTRIRTKARRKAKETKIAKTLRGAKKEMLGRCLRSLSVAPVLVDEQMHPDATSGVQKANAIKRKPAHFGTAPFALSGSAICAREATIAHLLMPRSCTAKPRLRQSHKLMLSRQQERLTALNLGLIILLHLYQSQRRNLELQGTERNRLSYVER